MTLKNVVLYAPSSLSFLLMSTILNSALESVGKTPLIRIQQLTQGLQAEVLLKCEFRNPLFSVKDRVGCAMIEAAERDGSLSAGGLIIEPTSGNTGIALAFTARNKGYRCMLVMPESMSIERRTLLKMLGAEIVLTPAAQGMKGAIAKAAELTEALGAFSPKQFDNPANPAAHYGSTGPEIFEACDGKVDIFVAGVGTGGTLSGAGAYLKEHAGTRIVAVEPASSPVISGGAPGPHKIQGIGAGFIPKNLNVSLIDEIIQVSDEDALETARSLAAIEGIPAGISSGANLWAAIQLAKRPEMAGKRIVTIACSALERYLSTALAEVAKAEVSALPVSTINQ